MLEGEVSALEELLSTTEEIQVVVLGTAIGSLKKFTELGARFKNLFGEYPVLKPGRSPSKPEATSFMPSRYEPRGLKTSFTVFDTDASRSQKNRRTGGSDYRFG